MRLPTLTESAGMDLLIATLGRKDELDRLLASLEKQTWRNFRILLADQNSPGYLDDILERHSTLSITRFMLPSKGVSIARNIMLEQAEAEIIVFPDDDCWYAPDTLERVLKVFRAYPGCGAMLGVWTASQDSPVPALAEGVVSIMELFRLAGTCVQFYRRDAIQGIRFDPVLGPGTGLPYGCGEDTDFLLFAHARTEVRRYKEIRVFHPSPAETLPPTQKVANYAAGRMYLLKKHKFSVLFRLANILYPLILMPLDTLRYGKEYGRYRLVMFLERLRNF